MDDDLLTEKEAQDLLKVSRTTLWRLRKTGGLPHHRVGGEVRYRRAALEQWLDDHPAEAAAEPVPLELDDCETAQEEEWRNTVVGQDWGFHDDPTNLETHGLHPYPAKFPPPLPARLIEILTEPGQTVLDPFCGSGTTLVEALRLDRGAVGVDVNPIGVVASKAKTHLLDPSGREALLALIKRLQADADRASGTDTLMSAVMLVCEPRPAPPIPNLENWFEPTAIEEIGLVLARIDEIEATIPRDIARACLSAILVQVSNQDSETRYTAKPRGLKPGEVLDRCARKITEVLKSHEGWARVRHSRRCEVLLGDARALAPDAVGVVHAVITSPPYANAFDYHLYHRHRMFWLGYDPGRVRTLEIGSHLNHQREADGVASYTADMKACMHSLARCTRPGTPAAFVVGDSVFHGEVVDNARILIEGAREAGFRCIAHAQRAIHPIKRSMIGPARRARIEHVILLVRTR